MKYEYFDMQWEDRPDWIAHARKETIKLWQEDYYKSQALSQPSSESNSTGLGPGYTTTIPPKPESDDEPWRRIKRARLNVNVQDELEYFQEKDEMLGEQVSALDYWIQKRNSGDSRYCQIAEMGIAVHSIPGMSAEPERVFSR
jgi:hAT family C-terminal dimerisation region